MKRFSDLPCMGRCKCQGLLKSFLSHAYSYLGPILFLYCSQTNSLFTVKEGKCNGMVASHIPPAPQLLPERKQLMASR